MPADLGFYDLRVPEVREQQANLAEANGIEGFCYWHYWFHGRRLLERPFNEVLASGSPAFPFCLAWANESWSRSWLGTKHDVILSQEYSKQDDIDHARWLCEVFADSRNIRVHGRPLFLIYKPLDLPDPRRTTDIIREEAVRHGLPNPYLVGINAHSVQTDMRELGFDMTENHEPQFSSLPQLHQKSIKQKLRSIAGIARTWRLVDYAKARAQMTDLQLSHPHFPAFCVGWDNTARRGKNAWIFTGNSPNVVAHDLSKMIDSIQEKPPQERIIFLNAWNEWAEGMILEPNILDGDKLLEEVGKVMRVGQARGTGI